MHIASLVPLFAVGLPLSSTIGLALIHLIKGANEKIVAWFFSCTMLLLVALLIWNIATLMSLGPLEPIALTWYHLAGHSFIFLFANNAINATYALVFSLIATAVGHFSITYLHKEQGFFEYYYIFFVFLAAILLVVFSHNMDTLFVGWEVIGLCSVLLIGFYKARSQPVQNSLYTLICYRVGELFLLSALTLAHLQYGDSNFTTLGASQDTNSWIILFVIIAVYVKSAQLPFSTWLTRAMEGPTPSSAIFYGGISTHLGPMLLVKLYPFFAHVLWAKVLLVAGGTITALYANFIVKTRTDMKSQLGYATITQLAIIFVEVGLGFVTLAICHTLIHCAARTFQFLKSPSGLQDFYQLPIENPKTQPSSKTLYYLLRSNLLLDQTVTLATIAAKIAIVPASLYLVFITSQNFDYLPGCIFLATSFIFALMAFHDASFLRFMLCLTASFILLLCCSLYFLEPSLRLASGYLLLNGLIAIAGMAYCLAIIKRRYGFNHITSTKGLFFLSPHLAYAFLFFVLCFSNVPMSLAYLGEDIVLYELFKSHFFFGFSGTIIFGSLSIAAFRFYCLVFIGATPSACYPKVGLLISEKLTLITLVLSGLSLPLLAFW